MNFTGEIPNEYLGQDSFFEGNAPLSIGVGYGIVLGFGMLSTIVISGMVWLDSKFNGTQINSEEFSSAGRSVKTGLVASVIVSQWTWAATLLQSSNVAYLYGISGPFWSVSD
jgi:urea-proton symporter